MLKFMEAGPEVFLPWTPSTSWWTGLVWNIRKFSRTVHGSLGTRSSVCALGPARGWKPHLGPTQPSCAHCHILPACLDVVWIDQPALGWGIHTTCSVPMEERKRSHWQIQAQKQLPRGESCRQGWEKASIHVLCLASAYSRRNYRSYVKWDIWKIYSWDYCKNLFSFYLRLIEKKKKTERERKLHISSRSSLV